MITRPTTDRGRATVARVLDAACALFAEKGVRATTDVVGLQVERIVDPIRPAVDAMSTADDVRNFCEAIISLHDSSEKIRCPLGSLVPQLDDDNTAREVLKAGFTQWEALLADGLRRVADSGGLISGADPAVVAGGLLAAYQGGMLLADVTGDVESLRRALNTVVTAVLTPAVSA